MGSSLSQYIQRLRQGDQSAFLPLYEKTAPGLMRFLMWKTNGDRALSEDILQDSFVRLLVNLDKLEAVEELAVQRYLLQMVKNCHIDKVARAPKAERNCVPLEALKDVSESFEANRAEQAIEMRELKLAMDSLNEKDSEIIWLRDALGLSHKEVADRIGISEPAARQAYLRAKRSLLSFFEKELHGLAPMGGTYATT
ncbi:MAG: sigma-70 family RNA polymerase sigma factor [Proteobacteria bacterium]|nr:sigma-70 family RNA polymerase sigma factor [Pseudomonadota bacterium]